MKNTSSWTDEYIEKSEDFAKPILTHFRDLVHEVCPDVEETKKWSFTCFMYRGTILCAMASFKNHCSFGFWKAAIMPDPDGIFVEKDAGMGNLGKLTNLNDLPPDAILKKYIREAMLLNETDAKIPARTKTTQKPPVEVPDYFNDALSTNTKARAVFDAFSPSMKREYVEWITDAKTEPTRNKRIAQAIEMIAEGKKRNWKYEKC